MVVYARCPGSIELCTMLIEVCSQGDNSIEPTTANYTFKHILEVQHDTYEIDLCPSQLRGVRLLFLCWMCLCLQCVWSVIN